MKVCILLQNYVANIGIYSVQSGESIFNRRNVTVALVFGQGFISVTAYMLFGSKTIREYEEGFFGWALLTIANIGIYAIILKTVPIFQLIEHVENLIEKRKLFFSCHSSSEMK